MAKNHCSERIKVINVKVVYYNGINNVTFADKKFPLGDFDIAYRSLEKWCFTFMCNGWQIYLDERDPLRVAEIVKYGYGAINIILKGDRFDVNDKSACYLNLWVSEIK